MTCDEWSVEKLLDLLGDSVDFKGEEAALRVAISLAELIKDRDRLATRVAELRAEIEELRQGLKEARRQACIWAVISSEGTKSAAQRLQDKKAACLVLGWPVEEVWPEDKDVFGEFIESQGKDPAKEDKE